MSNFEQQPSQNQQPTRTWLNPRWGSLRGPDAETLRAIFADLSEFLARPTFLNGIQVGDGSQPTPNPSGGPPLPPHTITIDAGAGIPPVDFGILEQHLADNAVSQRVLRDEVVSSAKLVDGAITDVKIALEAIKEVHISPLAITETKIADDAITTPKIAANAVTANEILAGSINTEKLAANAITADKIAANQILAGHIGALQVTAAKIDAGAVTAQKLAAGAVSAEKISAGAITSEKIFANAVTARELASITMEVQKWIRSNNYVGGVSGWAIDGDGDAEFNNVVVRGLVVSSTVRGSLIETAPSGNRVFLDATQFAETGGYSHRLRFSSGHFFESGVGSIRVNPDGTMIVSAPAINNVQQGVQVLAASLVTDNVFYVRDNGVVKWGFDKVDSNTHYRMLLGNTYLKGLSDGSTIQAWRGDGTGYAVVRAAEFRDANNQLIGGSTSAQDFNNTVIYSQGARIRSAFGYPGLKWTSNDVQVRNDADNAYVNFRANLIDIDGVQVRNSKYASSGHGHSVVSNFDNGALYSTSGSGGWGMLRSSYNWSYGMYGQGIKLSGYDVQARDYNDGWYGTFAGYISNVSSREFKTNIKPYGKSALPLIRSIGVSTFAKKGHGPKEVVGLILEDLPEEVISTNPQAYDVGAVIALLWKAVQELDQRTPGGTPGPR